MNSNEENRGYTLTLANRRSGAVAEKVYLKPMALYVPSVAADAVAALAASVDQADADNGAISINGYTLTVTNNNNGVSVDRDFVTLAEPDTAADAVKDLINIVRGYDDEDEHNVCGW